MSDKYEHARKNAKGWLSSIEDMLSRHDTATEQAVHGPDETDATRREIEESVLSVRVRGWHTPGTESDALGEPEEYEILLTTGGPALRIIGQLDAYCQPTSAELQMQDWGVLWERYPAPEATLLEFASVFWFGG